jgi:hypothetical protein
MTPPAPLDVDPEGPVMLPLQAVNPRVTTTAIASVFIGSSASNAGACCLEDTSCRSPLRENRRAPEKHWPFRWAPDLAAQLFPTSTDNEEA